jgi:iron complex outermembrane receptor protein
LELNDAQGNDIGAVNVAHSYHQGIEAGLEIELLEPDQQKQEGTNRLTLSQTYTLNDFHFDDDPVYGNNHIAGVPQHLYEAELLFTTPAGFYIGPNLQWNITHYPVDQANTLFADSYALVGFKVGYRPRKGFAIFLEGKNLTDKRFASAVDPIADARTTDNPRVFHPGDGRAVYGGVSWCW